MTAPTLFDAEAPAAPAAAGPRPEPAITITVHGLPAPQGSKSPFRNQHTGRIHMPESSKKVKPWRQDVKGAALDVINDIDADPEEADWVILTGPLAVAMTFTFNRPKGHYRTGRNAHLLRDAAPPRPAGTPDLSKLARSTEDALTGVVWKDDALVVEYLALGKWYAGTDAADVLAVPGCVIRVWPLTEAVTG